MSSAGNFGLDGEDEVVLDGRHSLDDSIKGLGADCLRTVLDLPQLYTKPTASILLATLADLSTEPLSWDATSRSMSGPVTPVRRRRKIRSEGVPAYLTKIIASPLAWIADDAEKEQVWEAASRRLSERSGRTGMGAISRTFRIPLHNPPITPERGHVANETTHTGDGSATAADDEEDVLNLVIHEPALTADNLGLKTWASSYLLAKRLVTLRPLLPSLAGGGPVLELGAGTGLVGMTAAAVLQADVYLTDLPAIVPNLARNVLANSTALRTHGGGEVHTAVLDWSDPAAFSPSDDDWGVDCWPAQHGAFPLILAADPIYSPEHPRLLVQAVDQHLKRCPEARVVVELPVREAYGAERRDLRERMEGLGLRVLDEGEEVGFDDWGIGGEEEEGLAEVRCWWSVWGFLERGPASPLRWPLKGVNEESG